MLRGMAASCDPSGLNRTRPSVRCPPTKKVPPPRKSFPSACSASIFTAPVEAGTKEVSNVPSEEAARGRAAHGADAAADDDFPIGPQHDGGDETPADHGVESRVHEAVRIQPREPRTRDAIHRGKGSADEQLSIGLRHGGQHGVIGGGRIRLERAAGGEPRHPQAIGIRRRVELGEFPSGGVTVVI